jgi:hypothetical protein
MKKPFLPIALAVLPLFSAGIAAAATLPKNIITNSSSVVTLLCNILSWVFWVFIVVAVIMTIYAAFLYATSGGDAEKVSKANKTFLYVAIAILVALMAGGFPMLIGSIFGSSGNLNACGGS